MPYTLTTTVSKILLIPNRINMNLVNEFHDHMRSRGCSERHRNNTLQVMIGFANSLDCDRTFYDALVVDPRDKDEALVQRLPRDQKDRRVNIYNNYISYFDNETTLNSDEMDELCTWVTGYSGTVRVLHTTDESRTYSGKRPIGINGINIPVVNSDILSRSFVVEMQKVDDGSDGLTESQLIPENEIIDDLRNLMPEISGHIFDTLVKALRKYDDVRKEIKPNHRLADFVIWGRNNFARFG
jgi:hypothetical protein